MTAGSPRFIVLFLVLWLHAPLARGGESAGRETTPAPPEKVVLPSPQTKDAPTVDMVSVKEASVCKPWPECVASWFDAAAKERASASTMLVETMDAIKKGWEQNCTRSSQCSPEKRMEEIDSILQGVQKKWEEQAASALAARSKAEDNLWKRWINEAQERVKDIERLNRVRAEQDSVFPDIWLRRMSARSLDVSLLPGSQAISTSSLSMASAVQDAAGIQTNLTGQAAAQTGWERGGSKRNTALAETWFVSADTTPNVTRAGALRQVQSVSRCILRDLLDLALGEGDVQHASCPPNGKGDCFERCRRYCRIKPECQVFAVLGSSCVISAASTGQDMIVPLIVRLPDARLGYVAPTAQMVASGLGTTGEGEGAAVKSRDTKLQDMFKKLQRQAPHSQNHMLCVIVPFRDGCSAMSQVCHAPSRPSHMPRLACLSLAGYARDASLCFASISRIKDMCRARRPAILYLVPCILYLVSCILYLVSCILYLVPCILYLVPCIL